jgi:hypothetical protein
VTLRVTGHLRGAVPIAYSQFKAFKDSSTPTMSIRGLYSKAGMYKYINMQTDAKFIMLDNLFNLSLQTFIHQNNIQIKTSTRGFVYVTPILHCIQIFTYPSIYPFIYILVLYLPTFVSCFPPAYSSFHSSIQLFCSKHFISSQYYVSFPPMIAYCKYKEPLLYPH